MNEHHSGGRVAIRLDGVPETMLMPLWNRAADAAGPDPLLIDPMATELVRRIDYDFRARFGKPSITHAIRARFSDELIREFLARRPAAQVVALGEGLETQFWRVDNGSVEWISVDLPEAIEVRRRLLPPHPRNILIEGSALDLAWRRVISTRAPVFVIAAGLLMYFERTQVVSLLRQLAEHCDGGELFFDTIPPLVLAQDAAGVGGNQKLHCAAHALRPGAWGACGVRGGNPWHIGHAGADLR